jgi:hypothetical protein
MTSTAYYSTTFDQNPDAVWAAIRRFDDYRWGEGVGESLIENDAPANRPGAIRRFLYYGQTSRQRLLEHSDEQRTQQWESAEAFDPTLSHYTATIRVAPVVHPGGTFIEWTATFEASDSKRAQWHELFVNEFGKSLERLRGIVSRTARSG